MNIKRSINVAIAMSGMKKNEFAAKIGISKQRLYSLTLQKSVKMETVEKLAAGFGMKPSEFIALGED